MYPYIYLFGRVIGSYGLCMALGILLAGFLAVRKGKQYGVPMEDILIVGAMAIGLAVVCGGLLYCFVTYPMEQIIRMIRAGDFSFLAGGIVFYGGLIGGIGGALLGARIAKCSLSTMIPVVVPYVPLGHAIGRIGCVMAGCCHGMAYDGPLAVYYPHSVLGVSPEQGYFPVQPLEAVMNVLICLILLQVEKQKKQTGALLPLYLGLYAVTRFTLEFFRGDQARGIYFGVSVSQWISIGLLIISILCFLLQQRKPKTEQTDA